MSSRRRSSLNQQQPQRKNNRRHSVSGTVRRSSRKLDRDAVNDLSIHLGRVATEETPKNKMERRERRSSRKEGFERVQSHRAERMGSLKDQWTSHRQSFVCEEDEIATIVQNNPRWSCCGLNLCCTW